MKRAFQGWQAVGDEIETLLRTSDASSGFFNAGQRLSLRGIVARLPSNGVVIADEVGMGKTRIAVAVARSVIAAGGRVAILVPPGLGFQWQDELRDGGVEAPGLLRSLWQFLDVWMPGQVAAQQPWFERDVVLVSHAFTNWRLGDGSDPWRWALLPALFAWWKKLNNENFPGGFKNFLADDYWAKAPLQAGQAIAKELIGLPANHTSRSLMEKLSTQLNWSYSKDPANYGRGKELRPWLESAVGLGLGSFNLVIVDEAHKSRGDESGLSRMLDGVIVAGAQARRFSMTATPVELDASQWHQALDRIGANGAGISKDGADIFKGYADTCARVRQYPHNLEAREDYMAIARLFTEALKPYLIRRDKRELECVQIFADRSGLTLHDYRELKEITVDTAKLKPAWQQAVCAAEALSIATRQADDSISKRLRLTMGNGHGISALLDHVKQDKEPDRAQIEHDGVLAELEQIPAKKNHKRVQRVAWWKQVIGKAFEGVVDPLYDHPAILAAVNEIEKLTAANEKVLVFGRFTLPLQALVAILNARAMLRAINSHTPWPQAKVHEDEWLAVQAAHRQLLLPDELNRQELDQQLKSQYGELESRRQKDRDTLLVRLDEGLKPGRSRAVFEAFRQAVNEHDGPSESPLVVMTKALHELSGSTDNKAALATAFEELIEAISARDEGDDDGDGKLSAREARELWGNLQGRLDNEYNRVEGGFARLMFGGTDHNTRRLLQLAFNRSNSNPRVLVAQSVVGREGLNLHRACKTVILLHPEWNPGVVEQQIGRVDRVGSKWEADLNDALRRNSSSDTLPRILIRPVIFRGTYDERNWEVLQQRWDDLRAQLHGVVISSQLEKCSGLSAEISKAINDCAPCFSPTK